jgi:acetylornithine deacetylase/succinyl-diaminopimelate desuccinylase-like protein
MLLELARKLIGIDSSVAHGNEDIARFVSELAADWGLHAEVVEETWNGINTANVLIAADPAAIANDTFLLSAPLDTADPGEYGLWTKTGASPFKASLDGGSLYGLGTADAKLDFLAKMQALRHFVAEKNFAKKKVLLLGSFGRESGAGAIRLIRHKKIKPRAALVGAPTRLRLASRAPGYAKVEIALPLTVAERQHIERQSISEGSYSQSKIFSSPAANKVAYGILDNPIIKMIDYLRNLPSGIAVLSLDGGTSAEGAPDFVELEVQLVDTLSDGVIGKLIKVGDLIKRLSAELKAVEDKSFVPAHSTVNVGQIRMFSEEVKITGICRLVPTEGGRETYEVWLERMRQDCAAAGCQFQILDYKPPFLSDPAGAFFAHLKGVSSSLGLDPTVVAANQCTEASVFHRLGIQTAVFGPGEWRPTDQAPLERIEIQDLLKASAFYQAVLKG